MTGKFRVNKLPVPVGKTDDGDVVLKYVYLYTTPKQAYHQGHCINCSATITATSPVAGHTAVKAPCPECGRPW